ncbi:MAG: hypothetical protein ACYCYI_05370 [Saccharofermentanales bacterium]
MAKLNRIHKRTGFVILIIACVTIIIALLIVAWASYLLNSIARSSMMSVTISNTGTNIGLLGSGIDLDSIPTTNLLKDASFEPNVFREVFVVEDGDDKTFRVSNDQAKPGVYGEGFFTGASLQVVTNSKTGIQLRKSGKVKRYSPNQIGTFQKSPISGDIPSAGKLLDYATKSDTVIVVGEKGTIIKDSNKQSPTILNIGISTDIVSITNNAKSFFACTKDGVVLTSIDGETWKTWRTPAKVGLNAIAASSDIVVAVGDKGTILTGNAGTLYFKEIGLEDDIADITYGNDMFVAVTKAGNIIYSPDGLIWSKISPQYAVPYTKIEYADTLFALLTQSGIVQIYPDIKMEPVRTSTPVIGVVSMTVISKSKILLLEKNNRIYQSDDKGITWSKSRITPPSNANIIGSVGAEEILCSTSIRNSYISRLVTEIEVDSALKEGSYQAGDMCYIDIEYPVLPNNYLVKPSPDMPNNEWVFYGAGDATKEISDGAPYDGVGVMKLSSLVEPGNTLNHATISQRLLKTGNFEGLSPSSFYIFSIWIKQDKLTAGTVKVWISGQFDSIGTEFTDVGTSWKKYSFKFLFPPNITGGQAADARINIGTTNKGVFFFDKAYLGTASENSELVPSGFNAQLEAISPSLIRTNFLNIGTAQGMPNRWAKNGELDRALNIVLGSNIKANPWIVIDSHISDSEMRNLIEYLAGPISSDYGRYRMENGQSLLWSNLFDRIMFEFVDNGNILTNDVSRAIYVNHFMGIIESSHYYENIKKKVVFVDGTEYSEGLMLSRADYSASDFTCRFSGSKLSSIKASLAEYNTLIPRNTDRPANLPINLLRATSFGRYENAMNTAELVTTLLGPLGVDVNASLISMPVWKTSEWSKTKESAARIAGIAGNGETLNITKTQITKGNSLVECYAFKVNDVVTMVFASHNVNPVAISVDIANTFQGAELLRFDAFGEVLEEAKLKNSDKRFNILPGNVIVIRTK